MKKLFWIAFLVLICSASFSQNIVPNPSFEDTISCPVSFSDIINQTTLIDETLNAPPWHCATIGSADYFNQCNDSTVGVPSNYFGYQFAMTGFAYMGLSTGDPGYREYISSPMLDTLIALKKYFVSLYVSLNCIGSLPCSAGGTDLIGVYFSNGTPDTTGIITGLFPFSFPQVSNDSGNIISDTLNWVKISGSFTASGGENYITIGGFGNGNHNIASYYYIDDVCVTSDSLNCNSPLNINESSNRELILLFPNPFDDHISITVENDEAVEIIIYDIASRKVLQENLTTSASVNTERLSKGIYLYNVKLKSGVVVKGKVVKE